MEAFLKLRWYFSAVDFVMVERVKNDRKGEAV
jgi:hypothetical protein